MTILVTGANGQLGNEMRIVTKGSNTECDMQPRHSNEFSSPVKRPAYSVLDKTRINKTFGIRISFWADSLKVCINNCQL